MWSTHEVASQAFLLVMQHNGSEVSASVAHTLSALLKLSTVLLWFPVLPYCCLSSHKNLVPYFFP